MFLNILRISALNVLKTFFINKTVTIGCAVTIFHSHKPTGNWPARKQDNNKKNDLKTKLYMYTTKGDDALAKINRETNYFHDFVQFPK